MDEKKIIKLSNEIVSTIVDISLGEGKVKSIVPQSVANILSKDVNLFNSLKECYIEYLSTVDNKIDETSELKKLTEFRYQLVEIFEKFKENNEQKKEENNEQKKEVNNEQED